MTSKFSLTIRPDSMEFDIYIPLLYMQADRLPMRQPPKPPPRISHGTAVFYYGIGINSTCPFSGSDRSLFAVLMASTVDPHCFATSQRGSSPVFLSIKEGRFGSGSSSSPASRPTTIGIPQSLTVVNCNVIILFAWIPLPEKIT